MNVKVLQLRSFHINSPAAEALSRSLQSQHCSLVTLELNECYFLGDAFKQLAISIGKNTSLHHIRFSQCSLDSADVEVFTDAIRENRMLKMVVVDQVPGPHVDEVASQALEQCNPVSYTHLTLPTKRIV